MWGILNFIMFIVLLCSPETFFGILALWLLVKHPVIFGIFVVVFIVICILGADGSVSYYSEDSSNDDQDNGSVIDAMAFGAIAGMALESAYQADVEREAERQRLLEKDPMAKYRV